MLSSALFVTVRLTEKISLENCARKNLPTIEQAERKTITDIETSCTKKTIRRIDLQKKIKK